ncbi:H-NS histone family protein [Rhodobacteraceae bacterium CCMM004]|nr:H-NS histone family protein [Rhodobacteraceae bacterium CCMM004]
MMSIDLDKMSRQELEALRKDVDKALESLDARRKADARKAAENAAKEHGFNLDELLSGEKKKQKSAAKYAHPENPKKTWTGRGRQPAWIKEGLASGKSLEDFAI